MKSITHREMRNNSAEILRRVSDGESIEITNNGRVAAVLSPPNGVTLDDLIAQGHARQGISDLSGLLSIERRKSPVSSREIIDDSRGRW
jgi:prevent-host-death family protein